MQETHSHPDLVSTFEAKMRLTHRCFWCHHSQPTVGGILIVVATSFLNLFQHTFEDTLEDGRCHILFCKGLYGNVAFVVLHVEPILPSTLKCRLLRKIRDIISRNPQYLFVIMGDFNWEAPGESTLNATKGKSNAYHKNLGIYFDELFHDFTEWFQPGYTRRGELDGNVVLSRLDRIYSNHEPWRTADCDVGAECEEKPTDTSDQRLSDHLLVNGYFLCRHVGVHLPRIPHWIAAHPYFSVACEEEAQKRLLNRNEFENLRVTKEIFHAAARRVKHRSRNRGAQTSAEKAYWTLQLLRGHHFKMPNKVADALQAFPDLAQYFDLAQYEFTDAAGINHLLAEHITVTADENKEQVKALSNLPEYQKSQKIDALTRWAKRWSPKGRQAQLQGIRRPNGTIASDPQDALELMNVFWSAVFSKKKIDKRAAKAFVRQFGVRLPSIEWLLTFKEFGELLDSVVHSAPGPDGIPFACWKHAPTSLKHNLYAAYVALLSGSGVPDDFNIAFMIFLPKGSHTEDNGLVARSPEDTRPLSLSNTDAKSMANAIRSAAQPSIAEWACKVQRGFLPNFFILDNVIGIGTEAMIASSINAYMLP